MGNNSRKWDNNFIVALLSLIATVVGLWFTLATPELRNFFGLKDGNPPAPQPKPETIPPKIETPPAKPAAAVQQPPAVHEEKEPSDPQEYIIGENKSELAQEAKTRLSVSFHDDTGAITAKLIIAPAGKEEITLPTVGIGSQEFASSTGVFLVHILNVDWNSRTITVQVSRKI